MVTCIREGCTIDALGFRRERSAERFLKPPGEMARLLERHPDAVARTLEAAGRCGFSLDKLRYQYPSEVADPGSARRRRWSGSTGRACPSATPMACPSGSRRRSGTSSS